MTKSVSFIAKPKLSTSDVINQVGYTTIRPYNYLKYVCSGCPPYRSAGDGLKPHK